MCLGGTSEVITIASPITKVWEALTTPELIKQVLRSGDGLDEGKPDRSPGPVPGQTLRGSGEILAIDPPRLLMHSHWSPVSRLPDAPENYQRVSWELAEHGEATELTVREVNLPSEEAMETSQRSWLVVLENLKSVLEH
jgi:uncharacterized protein YndB with AHSA1/START domain